MAERRNLNPDGLAWPDCWFEKRHDTRTWQEKLAQFHAEMAKNMAAFDKRETQGSKGRSDKNHPGED